MSRLSLPIRLTIAFLVFCLAYANHVGVAGAPARGPWREVYNRVAQSAVFLDSPHTTCTAISISEQRGMFLTAAHCTSEQVDGYTLDGQPATVVWVDRKLDLAVLASQGARRRAIAPRHDSLVVGEEVALYGHGLGMHEARLRIGNVSVLSILVVGPHGETPSGPYLMIDTAALPGMSGGPLVDLDGRLVGVVQISSYVESGVADMKVVMKATRAYWE